MTLSVVDLPFDLIELISQQLDAKSFSAFTSTCTRFRHPNIRDNARYWYPLVRRIFRIPRQPVSSNDGRYWHILYRRLVSQSRLYTWGQDSGTSRENYSVRSDTSFLYQMRDDYFPCEEDTFSERGIMADIQCGGYGMVILNNSGHLFLSGSLNNQRMHYGSQPLVLRPPALIRQFSAGRQHVLGLSDSGAIYCWSDDSVGFGINFSDHSLHEGPPTPMDEPNLERGAVQKVVAGWTHSSALISHLGIVLWDGSSPHSWIRESDGKTKVVERVSIVPHTGYIRPKRDWRHAQTPQSLVFLREDEIDGTEKEYAAEHVGQVLDYLLLEHFVIFVTDLKKVFAARIRDRDTDGPMIDQIFEFPAFFNPCGEEAAPDAIHIQGAFRRFAVFFSSGAIAIGTSSFLDLLTATELDEGGTDPVALEKRRRTPAQTLRQAIQGDDMVKFPPELQNKGVISIAFGDHHYLALQDDGTVLSAGREPRESGALGLGHSKKVGRLRGLTQEGPDHMTDAMLSPSIKRSSKQVWFDTIRHRWLCYLSCPDSILKWVRTADQSEESGQRRQGYHSLFYARNAAHQLNLCHVADWIERVGQAMFSWLLDEGRGDEETNREQSKYDRINSSPYFAINIAAGGWMSTAQVLVDTDRVKEMMRRCVVPKGKAEPSIPVVKNTYSELSIDSTFGHTLQTHRLIWEMDKFPVLGSPPMDGAEFGRGGTLPMYRWIDRRFERTNPRDIEVTAMKQLRLEGWPSWIPSRYFGNRAEGEMEWFDGFCR